MNKDFISLLKNVGLTVNQIQVYLSVLKSGLSSVTDISRDTRITRSQVYIDTTILLEKNLLEIAVRKPKKFLATNPNNIQDIVKQKITQLNKLSDMLPAISSFYDNPLNNDKDTIVFYEGVSKVRAAMSLQAKEVGSGHIDVVVGNVDVPVELFTMNFWKSWNGLISKNGGAGRIILDPESEYFNVYKNKREGIILDARGLRKFSFETNFAVWNDSVMITIFGKKPVSVLFRSRLLSKSYKDIFEQLWKSAE